MSLPLVKTPFETVLGLSGTGLNAGKIYIGVAGQDPETNPQPVFWDAAGTVPALQPLATLGGYIARNGSPARAYVTNEYSMRVRDRFGVQIFYEATVSNTVSPSQVLYNLGLTNTLDRSLQDRLSESYSAFDWIPENLHAATRSGSNFTDLQPFLQQAVDDVGLAGGGTIKFPPGTYRTSGAINITTNGVYLVGSGRGSCRFTGGTVLFDCFHFGGVTSGTFRGGVTGFQIDNYRIGVWLDYGSVGIEVQSINFASMVGCVQVNGQFNSATAYDSFLHTISNLELGSFSNFGLKFYHCGDNFAWNCKTTSSISTGSSALIIDTGATAIHVWDCNFAGCLRGIHIRNSIGIVPNPNNLVERPSQCFFTNVLGDTSADFGWYIQNAQQMSFLGCWGAGTQSGQGYGFLIGTDVYQLDFTDTHLLANHRDGMRIAGPNPDARISINGGYSYANGFQAPNTYDGISVEPGVKHVKIVGLQAYDDSFPRRSGSKAWDPPSLANGASTTTTVTVAGVTTAWTRSYASLSTMPVTTPPTWTCTAQVTSADTVTVTLTNNSGATVDLPAGTLSVSSLDPRSNGLEKTQRYGVNLFPDQLGSRSRTITAASKANPASITSAEHGFITGQSVTITGVSGMIELNGNTYTVTVVDVNTYTIGVNGTGYGAYTSGGSASGSALAAITAVTKANPGVLTVNNHGFINNQDVFITGVVGMVELAGYYTVVLIDKDHVSLKDTITGVATDTTAFTNYTSGGTLQQYDMTDYVLIAANDLAGNTTGGVRPRASMRGTNLQIGLNLPAETNDNVRVGGGAGLAAMLTGSKTWDPPNVADGAMTSTTLSVPGAAVGDRVTASLTTIIAAGWFITGVVSAGNLVTVSIFNKTGGAVDLASGTLTATVTKTV